MMMMMTTTMMKAIIIFIMVFVITPNQNNNIVDCTDEHVVVSSFTTQSSIYDDTSKRLLLQDPIIASAEGIMHQSSSLSISSNDEQANKPSIVKGYTTVSRSKFMKQFDIGIPRTQTEFDNIVLLYTDKDSMISNATYEEKIDKCDTVKVVMTLTPKWDWNIKECIAIVDNGNIESSSVSYWQRTYGRRFNRRASRRTSRRTRRSSDNARDNDNNLNFKTVENINNNMIQVQNEKIITKEENNNNRLLSSTPSWHHEYKPYHWQRVSSHDRDPTGAYPTQLTQDISNKELMNYFTYYEDALKELENIAYIAGHDPITKERRPIIVMVMNLGHMHYFFNFMCTATARNMIDLSNIIIFTTDQLTHDIVTNTYKNLDNAPQAYYNEHIFGNIPTSEPSNYYEKSYGRIFMTKVYCVHLINKLKYDLIFSDVDLVLYRNPTEYFTNIHKQQHSSHNRRKEQEQEQFDNNDNNNDDHNDNIFDIYISDNGSDDEGRFQPYHGNTGFYYVAYNTKTQYFLYCLLKSGDLILLENSHQSVFLMIAYQHSTIRGLRLRTLYNKESYAKYFSNNNDSTLIDPNDNELVLSGYEYENKKELIEKVMNGEVVPFIFHANRFENHEKVDKLIETKNWYMKYDQCSTSDLVVQTYNNLNTDNNNNLMNECCLLQPYINITV